MIYDLARSYTSLGRAILHFPDAPWEDAISNGQLQSKAWAIGQLIKLNRPLGLVYVVGGWLGMLPLLMFAEPRLRFTKIRSFDIDPVCEAIADQVNIENVIAGWRFKAITQDMYTVGYRRHTYEVADEDGKMAAMVESCDTVINTCCDHLANFKRWWSMIPPGKMVVIQNNDFIAGADHVNTVKSLAAMQHQAPMAKRLFSGTLNLGKYHRFMLIGFR